MTDQPSHREIITRVESLDREFTAHREESVAYRTESRLTFDAIGKTLAGISEQVGRIERRLLAYDRMRDRIIGGIVAAAAMLAMIWWLTRAKIALLFGVEP